MLVLDSDLVVLQNLDHLVCMPAPAFAFSLPCPPYLRRWEMNSGVMLLEPSAAEHERMLALLEDEARVRAAVPSGLLSRDPGDQALWRVFFESVYELPLAYNLMRWANVSSSLAAAVRIVHDSHSMRTLRRAGVFDTPEIHVAIECLGQRAAALLNRTRVFGNFEILS